MTSMRSGAGRAKLGVFLLSEPAKIDFDFVLFVLCAWPSLFVSRRERSAFFPPGSGGA